MAHDMHTTHVEGLSTEDGIRYELEECQEHLAVLNELLVDLNDRLDDILDKLVDIHEELRDT